MKRKLLELVIVGLFALSVGTAGVAITALVFAQPAFAQSCGGCNGSDGCIGTRCTCVFDGGTAFHCAPPVK